MKVRDAIRLLGRLDPERELIVSVRVFTQAYSVAQCDVNDIDSCHGGAALHISLPDNMHVVTRKKRDAA